MTLWIDEPIWPAHGRLFGHLVSDSDYGELHALAARIGLPRRAFDGDHYDIPAELWADAVAAGATPTTGTDLARRIGASGLRLRKRKGDRGIARYLAHPFPNGASDVDLVASPVPIEEDRVTAAMVFVRDSAGSFVAVHSVRRAEWGSPGGWREPGESPVENAVRETYEETGLVLATESVVACGWERFTPLTEGNVITRERPYLQVFRTEVDAVAPDITQGDDGIHETRWMSPSEYAQACGHLFWWPLAAYVFPDLPPGRSH